MLASRVGAHVKFIGIDDDFLIDMDDLREKFDTTVKVVSFQYASNVTGAVHPLSAIRDIIGECLFFVDASQMGIHGPLRMNDIQCDAMVLSGHKMMADTGIGVLALARSLQKSWQSPISGGGAINYVSQDGYEQAGIPDRWEPGTPHITGAMTLTAAVDYLEKVMPEQRKNHNNLIQYIDDCFTICIQK